MSLPGDHVVRAMLDDGSFRIIAARTTSTVAGIVGAQHATGTTATHLGSLVTGAILFREMMAPGYRVQAILRGKDAKGTLVADSNPSGAARALVQLDPDGAGIELGRGAHLQMMRSLPNGDINQGVVELAASGDLSDAMMAYMKSSEQVTSVVRVTARLDNGGVIAAGGYMVQLLPEAGRESIDAMTAHLDQLGDVEQQIEPGFTGEGLIERIAGTEPFTWLGASEVRYECWCSDVRVMSALATLDRHDIEELIAAGEPVELNCDYCNTTYRIPTTRLRGLLQDS